MALALKGIVVKLDKLPEVIEGILSLVECEVLVGVPESKAPRKDEPITNAALAYIHENGSPARNIPARPFLRPGIAMVKGEIVKLLQEVASKALDGKKDMALSYLKRVGFAAVKGVQAKITDGPFAPLAQSTLASRRSRGFKGTKPLIVTGQLRRSITYVIRESKRHKPTNLPRVERLKSGEKADGTKPVKPGSNVVPPHLRAGRLGQ